MTRRLAALGIAVALVGAAAPAHAWFEQRLAGSRGFSMGASAAANVDDVTALYWNPAGLAWLSRHELMLDYAQPYLSEDLSENAAAFGTRWRGTGVAAGWHWLGIPGAYGELAATLSAGRVIARPRDGHEVAAGVSLQYLRAGFDAFTVAGTGESVDYGAESAFTADLGLLWRTPWRIDFAWVGRDVLVPEIRFIDGSPGGQLDFRNDLAVAFRWNRESTVTAGFSSEPGGGTSLGLGAEIWFYDVFAIRSGFTEVSKILSAGDSPNDFQYTGGFGVRHKGWQVDAAAFTNHDLGVSYRASLLKSFAIGGRP